MERTIKYKVEWNNNEIEVEELFDTYEEAQARGGSIGGQWVVVEVAFEEGQKCGNCGGKGRVWVSLAPDDGCYEVCEECDGVGQLWSSEWERDKQTGRL